MHDSPGPRGVMHSEVSWTRRTHDLQPITTKMYKHTQTAQLQPEVAAMLVNAEAGLLTNGGLRLCWIYQRPDESNLMYNRMYNVYKIYRYVYTTKITSQLIEFTL